jgi:2-polyprenyl-3-methyl-5-hydroxy-6-metoxy-1,4-benzoquinol methylase
VTTAHRHVVLHYTCDRGRLSKRLADAFVEIDADASTRAWIDAAIHRPQTAAVTAARDAAMKSVSLYDANALAGAYSMRVLSTAQWTTLLGAETSVRLPRLLDLGAGDGGVTTELAELFDEVVTTELSRPMARRLRAEGWTCHEVDLSVQTLPDEKTFDVISLLNLLDRTSHPLALLTRLRGHLAPGGRVVIAVPIPITQAVYAGTRTHSPEQKLPRGARGWEGGVTALYEQVLMPHGYQIERLCRAPYLCRGEAADPVKILDDAVFVLSLVG